LQFSPPFFRRSGSKDNNNEPKKSLTLNEDSKVMLPAIKVSSHRAGNLLRSI
jgi:hypothetical protein